LNNIGRYNEEQKAAWDEVYNPINEDFKKQYPNMTEEELMRWRYQRYMQDYLGTIAGIDEGVGQVLDYLDEAGLTENTIVVYTSDQGFYLGEHGWFDKRFMYEESFRTPLLMRYPKEIKPGTKLTIWCKTSILHLLSSIIPELKHPKRCRENRSAILVAGKTTQWRDAVLYTYYEYPSIHMVKRHYGVATNRYKLMHFYYDIDEWEMYDLETDPHGNEKYLQ
jgi:arylsulfatase A-like enzyme